LVQFFLRHGVCSTLTHTHNPITKETYFLKHVDDDDVISGYCIGFSMRRWLVSDARATSGSNKSACPTGPIKSKQHEAFEGGPEQDARRGSYSTTARSKTVMCRRRSSVLCALPPRLLRRLQRSKRGHSSFQNVTITS